MVERAKLALVKGGPDLDEDPERAAAVPGRRGFVRTRSRSRRTDIAAQKYGSP